jgi:hypothetical protein
MYGTYNSICSLATTTAAIVVLGDWFPAFVFASPFQLRFEGDMMERACYSDLLHCSMMMMLIVD